MYAISDLGYIWYYGRTGEKDYEKAFHYFSKAMERGNLIATYKVADMYKNGYFVEKDYGKYKQMLEELYPKVQNCEYLNDPVPEVYTRLAKIRTEEGKTEEALELYYVARDFLSRRIQSHPFFGDLNIMKWMIGDQNFEVESVEEDGKIVIRFGENWYQTVYDFFQKAQIDGELLTTLYEEVYDFKIL